MKIIFIHLFALASVGATAQQPAPQPFLFTQSTLVNGMPRLNISYAGSYGDRTSGPFGYDGVDQQLAVKAYLSHKLTLAARVAVGIPGSGRVNAAQQAEVLRDVIGGNNNSGFRIGVGVGAARDFDHVASAFGRITTSLVSHRWQVGANIVAEKPFGAGRDDIDLVTSGGIHRLVAGSVYAGFEGVAQDLEGFWDPNEAEGGARLLLGPSVHIAPAASRLSFSACGGPVFYATHSRMVPSGAIRDLADQNGYVVRAMLSFSLSGRER